MARTAYTNAIGKTGSNWSQTYNSDYSVPFLGGQLLVNLSSDSPDIPIPIAGNFKHNGANTDLVIVRGHYNKIEYYSFNKDFNKDNRLLQVKESDDKIVHTIDYATMEVTGDGLGNLQTDFYSSTNTETYPNIELLKNTSSYLVSKLTETVNGVSKFQNFRYHGYVSNFNYGSIGFKKNARSSWKNTGADSEIWTIQNNDPSLRGANTITWTNTDGSSVFASVPANLLSTKTNVFSTYTNPTSKVYNVLLDSQTMNDALTNVTIQNSYTYDGTVSSSAYYGLQTQSTTNYYNGTALQGTAIATTAIADYDNNPNGVGNAYHIGRPLKISNSKTIYDAGGTATDTKTSEEKYTYTGFNLSKTEKKGHNTDYLQEDMTYDSVGNLLTKTVSMPMASPAIASRTISDEYEATKRFVIKKTDHQGFISNFKFNPLGQLTKSTNYLGIISEFGYDNWGKITQSKTTNASATIPITTTAYVKLSDGSYTVTSTNTVGDNSMSSSQYDVLGRLVKTTTKGFATNSLISKSIEYDALGRKSRESEPYFSSATKWTVYAYDYLHRPTQVTSPSLRIQTLAYDGLSTTSVDDGKTTTATIDALGNKIQTTDPGGTINFSYYANGQLWKTNYDGHEIVIGIDGWGNKTSTFDPNAGAYTYEYDAFGQIKKETTPKGYTSYIYDSFGKLTTKKVSGDGADFNTTYTYNPLAQLTKEESKTTANVLIDSYDYGYDSLHRLTTTTENTSGLEHTKTIAFDTYGRLDTETNYTKEKLSGTNFSSSVIAKYAYNTYNGILYKITDQSNTMLWQLNTANEKMQTLTAALGNGIAITNIYSPDNYFSSQRHTLGTTDVLYNTYSFDAVKGTLTNRQNLVLGINENFTYDNLDRLLSWTNPLTAMIDSNVYDDRGRITTNNKLGLVNYNTDFATGIYKKSNVKLNTEGQAYYGALGGSQQVSYTMFKSPISITESGKGKIDFIYNAHLSRSKMLYDYGLIAPSTTKVQRKTKLFTDDGSTEILFDALANTIKIRTFVGGDAYTAVLYNEKAINRSTNANTEAKFYLHRDYLGSILAITNSAGLAQEKRHFDAWGNLSKLLNASNVSQNVANGLQFFDRGYTSHEHLKEVGLIQMNGRLYDPVLRSFLMPDNFIQQPENTQNYNRYAYVLNNPLMYTDPSGELFGIDDLAAAVIIGAVIAATSYTLTALLADVPFSLSGLAVATFIGAASAAVTFGIGSGAENLFTNFYSQAAASAVGHGLFQGTMSGIQGGSFWTGFAAGALSSIAASAWSGGSTTESGFSRENNWAYTTSTTTHAGLGAGTGTVGMIAFGVVAGGAGAALTGGNFWQGAAIGLVVSGLNHAMHDGNDGPGDPPTEDEKAQAEGWRNAEFKRLYELNEFCLDAYGFVRGAAEVSALKWGGFTTSLKGLFSAETKILVQFGKGQNQVSHAFRHVEAMGLSKDVVRSAILKDIPRIARNMPYGQSVNTTIRVSNQQIIYSSYKLPNGTINVGRITGLTK